MSLKTGFAQFFSCCPKNLSCPKFGGAAAPLAPPDHTPMCVADNRCLSYYLIPILGMDVLICELNDSDRFVGYVGGIYRGLEVKVTEELIFFM